MTQDLCGAGGRAVPAGLDGHATGSPEVCAAISGIVYCPGRVSRQRGAGRYAEVYAMDLEAGKVRIHCHGDDRVTGACEMAIIGLRQLEKQYPELLQMDFQEIEKFFSFSGRNLRGVLIWSRCPPASP